MGFGMAKNLAKAGVPLTVFDLSPEPLKALAEEGVSIAADPAELSPRLLTYVKQGRVAKFIVNFQAAGD